MASDPLSDPLSSLSFGQQPNAALKPPPRVPSATWARHDLFAEPFSQTWQSQHDGSLSDAAEEHPNTDFTGGNSTPSAQVVDREPVSAKREDAAPASSSRLSSMLDPDAEEFVYPSSSTPTPIPFRAPSTKASTSAVRSALYDSSSLTSDGATPRANPSPFSALSRLEIEDSERTLDLQSTPPASTVLGRSPPMSPTATSVKGLDLGVLKGLIAQACAAGNIGRLGALLDGGDGTDDYPSAFVLANGALAHTGMAPLHHAAKAGKVEVCRFLIEEKGAMPDLEDGEGETPLGTASHRGHADVVRYLLSAGASPDACDRDGWTPLMNAASRGNLTIVQLLVNAGADINKKSKHGFTALMNAAKEHLPVVLFLTTKHGADPFIRSAWGECAYDLAASVFEILICSHLAAYEASLWSKVSIPDRPPYNPLLLHSTCPVVLCENQRLALPTLRKISTLGSLAVGQSPRFSSKALSRNDRRAAFTMLVDGEERPVFRSEVGLPIIGEEGKLVLPAPLKTARGSGRPVRGRSISTTVAQGPRSPPRTPRRASAAASLAAVLNDDSVASSSETPSPSTSTSNFSLAGEPAFFWLSDWSVDLTDQCSSHRDGWSYATSFDAPAADWHSEPPPELERILDGTAGFTLGGQKWVRRRRWVRVMRRRLDLPSFGFLDEPVQENELVEGAFVSAGATVPTSTDYLVRAQFFAGREHSTGAASDRASIRSGKTAGAVGSSDGDFDRVELKRAAARLERAAGELRAGMLEEEDGERRRKAEDTLEGFLHQLALIRAALGPDDDDDDSEDDFIYDGRDADPADDSRSLLTSSRRESLTSEPPFIPASPSRPPLSHQLSHAPDFRVPTHESSQVRTEDSTRLPLSRAAVWESDEASTTCRRCTTPFSLFNRRHHCRRCGQLVCASCSNHTDHLDPAEVVRDPSAALEEPWMHLLQLTHRTCTSCHAALALPHGLGTPPVLSTATFFHSSVNHGAVSPIAGSDAGASDVSELTECPICGQGLVQLGERAEQEEHVKNCLEAGSGAVARNGRYLVFTLPQGPLVSEECQICFVELEVGDKLARLPCLCYFHAKCIKSWLSRGKTCPFHM